MIVTRFAPSPTGYLHLGHAYAALFAYNQAKINGGKFLLRIEDIDQIRCKKMYVDEIYKDLEWLGIQWDEEPLIQSNRMLVYKKYIDLLKQKGLLYPCVCSRKDIEQELAKLGSAPHKGETFLYPGICKGKQIDLSHFDDYSLRINIEQSIKIVASNLYFTDLKKGKIKAIPTLFGDIILARKKMGVSYHLCSVVDDYLSGVTLVTRGSDLFESTHVHRLLQELMGFYVPKYFHHELIVDQNGKKFSKRDASFTIRQLRESGIASKDVIKHIKENFFKKMY